MTDRLEKIKAKHQGPIRFYQRVQPDDLTWLIEQVELQRTQLAMLEARSGVTPSEVMMKFDFDGGNIQISDGTVSVELDCVELDCDQALELIQTYLDGLCHVCFEESFFSICCDCLQKGIEEHRKELHGCV